MRYRGLLIAVLVFAAGTVVAGPFEDGVAAHERKDYATALRVFRSLAERGDAAAQTFLGSMYASGQGVPKDDQQAVFWFHKAADQGDADAQFFLGIKYTNGLGVPKDDKQAVFWYRKAADQGKAGAQHNLAYMYSKGQGVPKDDQQAYFWWLLASVGGAAISIEARDLIESRLTPQQRATAQADARNWKPKSR